MTLCCVCGRRQNKYTRGSFQHLRASPRFLVSLPLWRHCPGTEPAALMSSLCYQKVLWCHQFTVKLSKHPRSSHPPVKSLPLSRSPEACSGQTVFSYFFFCFCQQSFLKEIFFQRNSFCLMLCGCLGTHPLSLHLSLSLALVSLLRDQLFLHTYTDSLCFFYFL